MSIIDTTLLAIAMTDIAGLIVWIGACLYLAYTKMDLMLSHLKNSVAGDNLAPLRHGGPWGKLLLVGGIAGFVTFPGFYLKRGQLNPDDLANFPAALKRKLVCLYWCVIGLLLVMVAFFIAIKLGWY